MATTPPAGSGIPQKVWDSFTPEQRAAEADQAQRVDAFLVAAERIVAATETTGAIDCPLCLQPGALRYSMLPYARKRHRRVVFRAKCTTVGCLEFMS